MKGYPIQWTPEQDEFIRQRYEAMTWREIADELQVCAMTVIRRAKALGLTGRKRRWDVARAKGICTKPKAPAKRQSTAPIVQKGLLLYRQVLGWKEREKLKTIGIQAVTYADAFDLLAARGWHAYVRPWQLTDVRYYEGRAVAPDGHNIWSEDADTWTQAAGRIIVRIVSLFPSAMGGRLS